MWIPQEIVDLNRFVTIVANVMFVCGLPFLISLSRRIRFVTLTAGELCAEIKSILKLYKRAGFVIQNAVMDNEFELLKERLLNYFEVNITAKNEHLMGEIERKIRHTKDGSRTVKASFPFKKLPNCLIKATLLANVVMWMNAFLSQHGVSDQFSPRELVLRRQLDQFPRHARAQIGSYCKAYNDPNPNKTNTQEERTKSCICLGPTSNYQGTYKFLNLAMGKVIKRIDFTELPIPDNVIRRVEYWVDPDKREAAKDFEFRNQNNKRFGWDNNVVEGALVEDNAI